MTQKKTKRFIRKRIKESDKPQMGRPAEKLSGDDVIGRRIPRGQDKKWWTCTNWRDRGEEAEKRVWVVREYEWAARCACGARMHRWKEYTLPPVSGHGLPAKCDACNDRVTGRDRVEAVSDVEAEVVSVAVAAKPVVRNLLNDCYWPLMRGDAVNLNWDLYGRDNVREMYWELKAEGVAIPASMSAYLGIAAEPVAEAVVEAVAEPVAPVVVEPEPVPAWEIEANEHIDRADRNEWYSPDWDKVDSRAIEFIAARGRVGLRVPHSLAVYRSGGGKGLNHG